MLLPHQFNTIPLCHVGVKFGCMAHQDETITTSIRIGSDIHRQLSAAAEKAGLSLNQEMVRRLRESFSDKAGVPAALAGQLDRIEQTLNAIAASTLAHRSKQ